MTIKQVGNPPVPGTVTFPPGVTTLTFIAIADKAGAAVNVTYRIRSPAGVTFANGSTSESLVSAPVGLNQTPVSKGVRFSAGGAPPVPIVVDGTVLDAANGLAFPLTWIVPVQITQIAPHLAAASVAGPATLAEDADPAAEAAALIRRLHDLLPALDAMSARPARGGHQRSRGQKKATTATKRAAKKSATTQGGAKKATSKKSTGGDTP